MNCCLCTKRRYTVKPDNIYKLLNYVDTDGMAGVGSTINWRKKYRRMFINTLLKI